MHIIWGVCDDVLPPPSPVENCPDYLQASSIITATLSRAHKHYTLSSGRFNSTNSKRHNTSN